MVVVVMVVLEASNVGIKISKNDKCNAWLFIILFILVIQFARSVRIGPLLYGKFKIIMHTDICTWVTGNIAVSNLFPANLHPQIY